MDEKKQKAASNHSYAQPRLLSRMTQDCGLYPIWPEAIVSLLLLLPCVSKHLHFYIAKC
jgi:hypothetical protein